MMLSEARALGIPVPVNPTVAARMAEVAKVGRRAREATQSVTKKMRDFLDRMNWTADRAAERLLRVALWRAERVVSDLAAVFAVAVPTWLRSWRSRTREGPPRASADVRSLVAAPHGPTPAGAMPAAA
ncbi:MAG: hypothetical protein WCF36_04760 [Candidatus Nanopelagicales bacterium]